MILPSHVARCRLAIIAILVVGCLGCGPKNAPAPPAETNLKSLAILYGRYIQQHRGQSPPNAEAFQKFVSGQRAEELQKLKIDDAAKVLVSPRDGQPYTIRYGAKLPPPGPAGSPVVGYEQTGAGGRRYVAFANAGVEEVDEARFRQLVPAP